MSKAPASCPDGSAKCPYTCSWCLCHKAQLKITGETLRSEKNRIKLRQTVFGVCLISFACAVLNPPCLIHTPYHALCFLVVGSEDERFNYEHPGNSNQSKYDQETLHFFLKDKTSRRAKSYFTSFSQLHLWLET